MLLTDVEHPTYLYAITEEVRNQNTSTAFGSQSNRDQAERANDQDQGRIGEIVAAKYLDNHYNGNWHWLDDQLSGACWEHDFVVETPVGGATVDVKTRRTSDVPDGMKRSDGSSITADPDHFTRYPFNHMNNPKTHIHNHIYIMVLLYDDLPHIDGDDYVAAEVVGVATADHVANGEEYIANPDNPNKYPKLLVRSTTLYAPDNLEEAAVDSINTCEENGGFPSVAPELMSFENSNLNGDLISDDKYWNPYTPEYANDDTTIPVGDDLPFNAMDKSQIPDLHDNAQFKRPPMGDHAYSNDVVQAAQDNGVMVLPATATLVSEQDIVDPNELFVHLGEQGVSKLTYRAFLSWWVSHIAPEQVARTDA